MCHKKVMLSLSSFDTVGIAPVLFSTAVRTLALLIIRKKQMAVGMLKSQRTRAAVNSLAFINNPLNIRYKSTRLKKFL